MTNKLTVLALGTVFLCFLALDSTAQLGKLKDKATKSLGNKIAPPAQPKEPVKPAVEPQKPSNTGTSQAVKAPEPPKMSLIDQVKKEQAKIESENQLIKLDNTTEEFGGTKSELGRGYLSFVSDYTKPDESKNSFSDKDFIYARLRIPEPIVSYLPTDENYNMEYYRVTIKCEVSGKTGENAVKIQRIKDFPLGYNTNDLLIAVVPEKGFFESILEKYKEGEKFTSATKKVEAYKDVVSRNFGRQISYAFKDLPPGQHKVDVEFSVTAKLRGSDFIKLQNIKGVFMLDVNEEAQQRFSEVFDLLTNLYRDYEDDLSIAGQTVAEDEEKEMLAKMSPREKERYLIAKTSPNGYMAAYGGEKAPITFSFGELRSKNAYLDVIWNDGPCDKCEAGTSSIMVTNNGFRTVDIPLGAKVSINGRTLLSSVSGRQGVKIYWYH